MLEFKQTIEEKAYNDMRERINGFLGDLASDGRVLMVNLMATPGNEGFYEKFGYVRRPNEEMGSGMVRWINR